MPRPSSRQYWGSWVLFPDPVSPATISTWLRRNASTMASRLAEIGRSASCLKFRVCAARAAAFTRGSLATLHFLPQSLLRIEVQIREYQAAFRRQGFHAVEPPLD